jgi:hypothetical protein
VIALRARVWRPETRKAELDGLRIHDLRHTAVALWIAAGAGPKEVATRAGHTSVSFTPTATATCTRRPTRRSATGWTHSYVAGAQALETTTGRCGVWDLAGTLTVASHSCTRLSSW